MENFHVSLNVQLNKDIKNPTMPGDINYPQVEAFIVIGAENGILEINDKSKILSFSIFQPQIIRVLRTVETIGFFNEFKEGALLEFYQNKMTRD